MDIDFASIDHYVTTHPQLDAADFAPLKIGGETCRLVALDAAGWGNQRLIDAVDATSIHYPTDPATLTPPHGFYQLYYDIERLGTSVGGISIQMDRGKKEAWISAWDGIQQQGIEMGWMKLPEQDLLGALGTYAAQHPAYVETFGLMPEPQVTDAKAGRSALIAPQPAPQTRGK